MSEDVTEVIAVVDEKTTTVYGYDEKFVIPTQLYAEIKQGSMIPSEGSIIRPISVIDYLETGANPVTMKATVAREVEIQRLDDKTRQNMILFVALAGGIVLLCAAIAYIMITKSADVASVAVQGAATSAGVSIT